MDVRSQVAMVFHLDKCIGCHTCSIACKNIWTDRKGTEYMWWNNVETKPGTGFPTAWENQDKYDGGWELVNGKLRLKSTSKTQTVFNIFHNPHMPTMDDYYEPWTYDYQELFNAPPGDDQPVARPDLDGDRRADSTFSPDPTGTTIWAARPSTRRTIRIWRASHLKRGNSCLPWKTW